MPRAENSIIKTVRIGILILDKVKPPLKFCEIIPLIFGVRVWKKNLKNLKAVLQGQTCTELCKREVTYGQP